MYFAQGLYPSPYVYKEENNVEKTKGEERKKKLATKQKNKLPLTSKGRKNGPLNQTVSFLRMTL